MKDANKELYAVFSVAYDHPVYFGHGYRYVVLKLNGGATNNQIEMYARVLGVPDRCFYTKNVTDKIPLYIFNTPSNYSGSTFVMFDITNGFVQKKLKPTMYTTLKVGDPCYKATLANINHIKKEKTQVYNGRSVGVVRIIN